MEKHSDFKIGQKYRCTTNTKTGVRLCVGIHPVNQRAILERATGGFDTVIDPKRWVEHREPREYWIVPGLCSLYPNATDALCAASRHNVKVSEVFRVREVIE